MYAIRAVTQFKNVMRLLIGLSLLALAFALINDEAPDTQLNGPVPDLSKYSLKALRVEMRARDLACPTCREKEDLVAMLTEHWDVEKDTHPPEEKLDEDDAEEQRQKQLDSLMASLNQIELNPSKNGDKFRSVAEQALANARKEQAKKTAAERATYKAALDKRRRLAREAKAAKATEPAKEL